MSKASSPQKLTRRQKRRLMKKGIIAQKNVLSWDSNQKFNDVAKVKTEHEEITNPSRSSSSCNNQSLVIMSHYDPSALCSDAGYKKEDSDHLEPIVKRYASWIFLMRETHTGIQESASVQEAPAPSQSSVLFPEDLEEPQKLTYEAVREMCPEILREYLVKVDEADHRRLTGLQMLWQTMSGNRKKIHPYLVAKHPFRFVRSSVLFDIGSGTEE